MNKKLIRLAWTFDDGPSDYTSDLLKFLNSKNIFSVTWFVSRSKVYEHNYLSKLRVLQDDGGEIGIHEIHPANEGINWFPRNQHSYKSIGDAVNDLIVFHKELKSEGITPSFVRLPGGEFSELASYLSLCSCPPDQCFYWAAQIIDGHSIPKKYACVSTDYKYLNSALNDLNLKIWSGAVKGLPLLGSFPYHYNSWQAECAGIAEGRGADNITLHQAESRKQARITEQNAGVFENRILYINKTLEPSSIVVLAHDTTLEDIVEIENDILWMEQIAEESNITVEYCTLSDLFDKVR